MWSRNHDELVKRNWLGRFALFGDELAQLNGSLVRMLVWGNSVFFLFLEVPGDISVFIVLKMFHIISSSVSMVVHLVLLIIMKICYRHVSFSVHCNIIRICLSWWPRCMKLWDKVRRLCLGPQRLGESWVMQRRCRTSSYCVIDYFWCPDYFF